MDDVTKYDDLLRRLRKFEDKAAFAASLRRKLPDDGRPVTLAGEALIALRQILDEREAAKAKPKKG